MSVIPTHISQHICSMWMAETIMTYLRIDEHHNLIDWGGHPVHYGLSELTSGQSATDSLYFLEGMLTVPHTQILKFVRIGNDRSAHIHIIPFEREIWVILIDATEEHDQTQAMQQQLNELSILTYRQTQLLQDLEITRQTLQSEKQHLEKASQLKSQFIATLSHELRSPLTSIVDSADLLKTLQQTQLQEEKYLQSVQKNAQHLLGLIDNLLNQAQLEIGQTVLQPVNYEIELLADNLKTLFLSTALKKGLQFQVEVNVGMPRRLTLDPLRFQQILINLISNALKFTQQGSVQVQLYWQAPDRLYFKVTDTGQGISQETQQTLFMPFQRGEDAKNLSGTGLGLAISHQLVNLMQGNLTVTSTLGQGTVFQGYIQVGLVHSPLVSNIHTNHLKVLVVDDSPEFCALMENYLREGGYGVLIAENGEKAIQLALEEQPCLVLMDVHLPGINGYAASQELRKQRFNQPIIAISASALPQDRKYAFEVGCQQYLIKPISSNHLLEEIKRLII